MIKLNPNTAAELFCLIIGLITIGKDKQLLWRTSLIYMAIVCFTEMVAGRWAARTFHNNIFVFNIFTLFEGALIMCGVHQCLKRYTNPTKPVIAGLVLFYVIYLAFFFTHGIAPYNTWSGGALSVIVMLHCFYYYYFVLTDDELLNVNTNPEFWWMTAVLFFYFGSTTGSLFHELFSSIRIGKQSFRSLLFSILNITFYSILAYSFICRSRQRNLPS